MAIELSTLEREAVRNICNGIDKEGLLKEFADNIDHEDVTQEEDYEILNAAFRVIVDACSPDALIDRNKFLETVNTSAEVALTEQDVAGLRLAHLAQHLPYIAHYSWISIAAEKVQTNLDTSTYDELVRRITTDSRYKTAKLWSTLSSGFHAVIENAFEVSKQEQ